jgi:hypothetical protein
MRKMADSIKLSLLFTRTEFDVWRFLFSSLFLIFSALKENTTMEERAARAAPKV